MRRSMAIVVAVLLSGCGKEQPAIVGGKPVNDWVEGLRDPDANARKRAALKLGNVGAAHAAVLPALMGALQDADGGVRCEAILAVLKCGPDAKQAVPTLTQIEKQDADPKVRDYAAKALDRLKAAR